MKMLFLKCVLSSFLCLGCPLMLPAAQITGGISLSGNVSFVGNDIDSATAFQSFSGVTIASVSGSYSIAGLAPGTAVSMSGFSFNPFSPAGVIPLWQTSSGVPASFDLTSLNIASQGNGFLALTGTGTLHLLGFDNTPGFWRFSSQQGDTTFSFSSSNFSVPDGGATLVLLALALAPVFILRRKVPVAR